MNKKYIIEGLDCPNCARKLEDAINKLDSVQSASINFLKQTLTINAENMDCAIKDIVKTKNEIEPEANIIIENKKKSNTYFWIDLAMLLTGIIIGLCAIFVEMPVAIFWTMYVSSALLMGYKTYYKALMLIFKGIINENLLVTISIIGAAVVGETHEGLMVIGLYSIGKVLEGFALNKSRKSIEELTQIKPDYAVIIDEDGEKNVDPALVNIGQIIIVRPGERVPIDGEIIEGNSSLDTQSLTGESLPVFVKEKDTILSGSIVLDGILKIRTTNEFSNSTVSRIMDLIENASEKKSKTETVISKFSKWYTLGVIALAILVWGITWAVTLDINSAVYRGLIFLVVSCPCAFAISVPLSYFSGLGNASRKGILIKGSNYLDACAKLNTIAFDKTGTLTTGEFQIEKIENLSNYSEDEIVYIASLGEQYSLHPLAISIVKANKKALEKVDDFQELSGQGVIFSYNNKKYFVGRKSENLKGTVVEVFEDDKKIGLITLSDKIKENSIVACQNLKSIGIKTILLSGDNNEVVTGLSNKLCIDKAYSELLPQEKYEKIEELKTQKDNIIGYVGDGINDAPSLMLADVGISMGLTGSSASIEASDIVITDDDPKKVETAIKISKYTRKIVWENIIFSGVVKVLFLTLGACGITGMLSAVIADVGVTLIAILNSLRALKYSPNKKVKKNKQ